MRGLWRRFVRRQAFGNERLAMFIVASWTTSAVVLVLFVLTALEALWWWYTP